MSRAQRLLDLIQILRGHRFPVTGAQLAAELRISLRTLYINVIAAEMGAEFQAERALPAAMPVR